MKVQTAQADDPSLNVSSLIDMVFLLLIYFMVSASLVKSEGDLGIKLPGIVQQSVTLDMPDEQIIEVRETGEVFLNGRRYGHHDSQDLSDLEEMLLRYNASSVASGNQALVTIWAADTAKHQRVIDVMNACAGAGIENVTFSSSLE